MRVVGNSVRGIRLVSCQAGKITNVACQFPIWLPEEIDLLVYARQERDEVEGELNPTGDLHGSSSEFFRPSHLHRGRWNIKSNLYQDRTMEYFD
jgi:hypothetical protein